MSEDRSGVPAISGNEEGASTLPPSLQILLNDGLYERMKSLANLMANGEGFTPKHLVGKPAACFAVINCALDWRMNPHHVARHTYQTPSGAIGFDGVLVQSILEKSGRFLGAPTFEYVGDWQKLLGKWEKATGQRGGEYTKATWTDKDAAGLGIVVRWRVRGEDRDRIWPGEGEPFWVTQCYPRNSPLWATDPRTQISYLAIRRFANLAAPGILGSAGYSPDDMIDAGEMARDVTPPPKPRRENFVAPEPQPTFVVINEVGEEEEFEHAPDAVERVLNMFSARVDGLDGLETAYDNNDRLRRDLEDAGKLHLAREIEAHYRKLVDELRATAGSPPQGAGEAQDQPPDLSPASPASHHRRNRRDAVVGPAAIPGPLATPGGPAGPYGSTASIYPEASADEPPKAEEEGAIVADRTPPPAEHRGAARRKGTVAGVTPQPAPQDIVAELGRKLTAAAQQGQRVLDKVWLTLSEHERDLARPMRAQYREIASKSGS